MTRLIPVRIYLMMLFYERPKYADQYQNVNGCCAIGFLVRPLACFSVLAALARHY
jgi:hypothetical protein